ncbi:2-dehydropantoate 2-reductase [Pseudolabrys sp. Root1462]|uniref:ketopantoate reductase family protein n=1 Tax=Pseudolabrys sp. Root1462 TaxID=1736466 RepID=UPI000702B3D5|nr:2-dehydropantoate 2-reductase [Pseudolabrys sp. Root1462]KQY99845.1 2-dehydropantoate 2-reductase [Pseudolabrys sp. Root1462]
MRIAAMAAGAVGGYFGARMAAAGHDVFFIARGSNLAAIKANGLKIESVHGDLHLPKPNVTDDPRSVGPVDVVLFAVKLWDTEAAAELTRPMVGDGTRVITLQNGVDSVERIAPILGADRTVGGTTYIATTIAAPGVIKHTSAFAKMVFGRADRKPDATLDRFVADGTAAKLDITLAADIERERWEKFIFLTAMSGSTATFRSSIGPIIADDELRDFFRQLMEEAFAVGRAKGVTLDHAFIDERMAAVQSKVEPGMKASMAHDLERGNRLELDWLAGKVRALSRELGVPTPASDTVYRVLKLHRMGR